jgi:hypothetical protein
MTEQTREALKRAVLDSAANDGLGPAEQARIEAALRVGGGPTPKPLIKVALGGLGVIAGVVGLAVALHHPSAQPIPKTAPSAALAPPERLPAPPASTNTIPTVDIGDLPRAVASSPKAIVAAPSPSAASVDELAELERIRSELSAGDAAGALRDLDSHDVHYNPSALADEATVLRVETLVALGQHAKARAVGTAFITQSPSSPYAKRVQSLIGGE